MKVGSSSAPPPPSPPPPLAPDVDVDDDEDDDEDERVLDRVLAVIGGAGSLSVSNAAAVHSSIAYDSIVSGSLRTPAGSGTGDLPVAGKISASSLNASARDGKAVTSATVTDCTGRGPAVGMLCPGQLSTSSSSQTDTRFSNDCDSSRASSSAAARGSAGGETLAAAMMGRRSERLMRASR